MPNHAIIPAPLDPDHYISLENSHSKLPLETRPVLSASQYPAGPVRLAAGYRFIDAASAAALSGEIQGAGIVAGLGDTDD